MKTTDKFQETGTQKTISKLFMVAVALSFLSFPSIAQDNNLSLDNSHATILALETGATRSGEIRSTQPTRNAETESSLEIESLIRLNDYKADQFAERDIELETEAWLNIPAEAGNKVEELKLQYRSLKEIIEFHAVDYVAAEMELEISTWESNERF